MATGESYDEFVDKFKTKKTTDDCYTPENIYEAVANYVSKKYRVDESHFVRPFYPGGDYEHYDYKPDDIVVDNPPFSILAKIISFYMEHGIPFFLFAPGLTTLSSSSSSSCMAICVGVTLEYENTAKVSTSFVTNLEPAGVRSDPELYRLLEEANKINYRKKHRSLPKYKYPTNVITASDLIKMSKYGVDLKIDSSSLIPINSLDSMKPYKKTIFGKGRLMSSAAAAAAAAAATACRSDDVIIWELSDRERQLIAELDAKNSEEESDEL